MIQLRQTIIDLNFSDKIASEIAKKIFEELKYDKDIVITQTGDDELLFYKEVEGTYKNLIVDEDGDIEILYIPKERIKTTNRMFYIEDTQNVNEIIVFFNGLP